MQDRPRWRLKLAVLLFSVSMLSGFGGVAAAATPDYSPWTAAVPAGVYIEDGQQVVVSHVPGSSNTLPRPAVGLRYAKDVVVVHKTALPRTESPSAGTGVTPHNADGCSPSGSVYATCIHIRGSKLTVTRWTTDAYYCSCSSHSVQAQYIVNGVILQTSSEPYHGPGRYSDSAFGLPRSWRNNTQLCNYWPGSSGGKPCETLHT
jgi:hypothetical protein